MSLLEDSVVAFLQGNIRLPAQPMLKCITLIQSPCFCSGCWFDPEMLRSQVTTCIAHADCGVSEKQVEVIYSILLDCFLVAKPIFHKSASPEFLFRVPRNFESWPTSDCVSKLVSYLAEILPETQIGYPLPSDIVTPKEYNENSGNNTHLHHAAVVDNSSGDEMYNPGLWHDRSCNCEQRYVGAPFAAQQPTSRGCSRLNASAASFTATKNTTQYAPAVPIASLTSFSKLTNCHAKFSVSRDFVDHNPNHYLRPNPGASGSYHYPPPDAKGFQLGSNRLCRRSSAITTPPVAVQHDDAELVRLLAQIRKQGMDILFPQVIHDKVMAAILVILQRNPRLPHRDIIDRIMDILPTFFIPSADQPAAGANSFEDNNRDRFPYLSSKTKKRFEVTDKPMEETVRSVVTKTKIRGVLALLKHANVLHTETPPPGASLNDSHASASSSAVGSNAVRLIVAPGMTFDKLRFFHDTFLQNTCEQFQISVGSEAWSKCIWTQCVDFDNEACPMGMTQWRLKSIKVFMDRASAALSEIIPENTYTNRYFVGDNIRSDESDDIGRNFDRTKDFFSPPFNRLPPPMFPTKQKDGNGAMKGFQTIREPLVQTCSSDIHGDDKENEHVTFPCNDLSSLSNSGIGIFVEPRAPFNSPLNGSSPVHHVLLGENTDILDCKNELPSFITDLPVAQVNESYCSFSLSDNRPEYSCDSGSLFSSNCSTLFGVNKPSVGLITDFTTGILPSSLLCQSPPLSPIHPPTQRRVNPFSPLSSHIENNVKPFSGSFPSTHNIPPGFPDLFLSASDSKVRHNYSGKENTSVDSLNVTDETQNGDELSARTESSTWNSSMGLDEHSKVLDSLPNGCFDDLTLSLDDETNGWRDSCQEMTISSNVSLFHQDTGTNFSSNERMTNFSEGEHCNGSYFDAPANDSDGCINMKSSSLGGDIHDSTHPFDRLAGSQWNSSSNAASPIEADGQLHFASLECPLHDINYTCTKYGEAENCFVEASR